MTTFSVTAGKTTVRNVKLTTGARVSGTVTGPDGRPVANVYVSVTRVGNDSGTRTDSKGRYRLEGLRTGTAVVSANGGSAFWNSTARVKVKVGSMAVHNATLKKSGSVTGTVMDQETGAPVPGVRVFLNSYTETTTDAQGKYSFTGIQYRTNTVNTSLTGLDPVPNLLTSHVETVIVGSGRRTVADFFLPRGAVVEGLITDSSGQPFDSGSVWISIWGYEEEIGDEGGWDFEDARGTANDDGTFRFERLGWSSLRAEVRLQYCPTRDVATQCAKLTTIPVQYRPGRITDLGRVAIDPTFSQVATTKVEGAAVVGQTLRAMPSTWHPTPVTRKYQWFRNGVAVEGATSRNYTLTSADRGARMSVEYTGSSPRFVTASSLSAQTPKVAAAS